MKLNPKLTGGLAWAGLVVILAVPAADMLTKKPADATANVIGEAKPVETALVAPKPAVRPVVAAAAQGDDPVDSYVSSGKKLPSYISDAPAEVAAAKPAPTVKLVAPVAGANATPVVAAAPVVTPAVPAIDTTTVASLPVAPIPYPADKRPKPVVVASPSVTQLGGDKPLVVDEEQVARRDAAVTRVLDDEPVRATSRDIVTSDQLEEWDSGSLAEYLERRGMINEDQPRASSRRDLDADGFFLDDRDDGRRVIRRLPRNDFFLF